MPKVRLLKRKPPDRAKRNRGATSGDFRVVELDGGRGPLFAQPDGVMTRVLARRKQQEYWPQWAAVAWLTVGVVTLLSIAGCRRGVPVLDTSPRPAQADGTISGTVRGPETQGSIEGRVIEIINVETNERQRVTTNNAGGFTAKVKPGRYRVELTLREGESLVKQPAVMHIQRSDIDAHADFIIGITRISRPRAPSYRTDNGLGNPTT